MTSSHRSQARSIFREAGADDFTSILRLYRQLHPADPAVTDGSDRAVFGEILAAENLHVFVLEDEGGLIATTYLNVIPNLTRSASPYGVVENVVVDETRRGAGVGKQIMTGTLQRAWADGCYKVMLSTGSREQSTHAFYRACGFMGGEKTAYVARPS